MMFILHPLRRGEKIENFSIRSQNSNNSMASASLDITIGKAYCTMTKPFVLPVESPVNEIAMGNIMSHSSIATMKPKRGRKSFLSEREKKRFLTRFILRRFFESLLIQRMCIHSHKYSKSCQFVIMVHKM